MRHEMRLQPLKLLEGPSTTHGTFIRQSDVNCVSCRTPPLPHRIAVSSLNALAQVVLSDGACGTNRPARATLVVDAELLLLLLLLLLLINHYII